MLCRHLFWLSIGTVAERRETPWEEWLIPWSEGPDSAPCCPGGGLAPFIPLALFPGMVSVVVVVGWGGNCTPTRALACVLAHTCTPCLRGPTSQALSTCR